MPNVRKGKNVRKTVSYCLSPDLLRALDTNRRTYESKSRQLERLLWSRLDPTRIVVWSVNVEDADYGNLGMLVEAKLASEAAQQGLDRHTAALGAPPVSLETSPYQEIEDGKTTRFVFRGRKVSVKMK